ncbi:hypothetical protein M1D48_18690 [Erwinia sp. D4-22]
MTAVNALCRIIMALSMLIIIIPCISQAACTFGTPVDITLPDIVLTPSEKGTPGTVLHSQKIRIPAINYSCDSTSFSTWRSSFTRSEFAKTSLDNIYSTGIAGIGVRIKWPESRGMNAWVPGAYQCQGHCSEPSDNLVIEFVQTGNSRSGVISAGSLMEVNVSSDNAPDQKTTLLRVHNNPITVQIRSCSIIASSNHIDLGDYALSDVTKSGFTAPKKDFQITINCPSRSTAQIQFDGITEWGQEASLIKNQGSAKYVYVKLKNKYGSCARCYDDVYLNEKLYFGEAAPFIGTRSVNYAAEMIFDEGNRSKITAGNVEASVVFTLTIN